MFCDLLLQVIINFLSTVYENGMMIWQAYHYKAENEVGGSNNYRYNYNYNYLIIMQIISLQICIDMIIIIKMILYFRE